MLICFDLAFVQKRRRPTLGVQLDDKRKEMLKRHPLSVMLDLKCKGRASLVLGDPVVSKSLARCGCPRSSKPKSCLTEKIVVSYFSVFPRCLAWSSFDFFSP